MTAKPNSIGTARLRKSMYRKPIDSSSRTVDTVKGMSMPLRKHTSTAAFQANEHGIALVAMPKANVIMK
tara:strand:- start:75 stop:281 length:207 start_codon:yes stop_codon:yes gene_type:complete